MALELPNLNVIEHVRAELKQRHSEMTAFSKAELVQKHKRIWGELGQENVHKLVYSFYEHCIADRKARGIPRRTN